MPLSSIALIPDGNRRYAEKKRLTLAQAYSLGTQKAWDVLDWLGKYPNIKTGTFYTLSLENMLARRKGELIILYRLFAKQLQKARESTFFPEKQIRLKFVGRLQLLPKALQQKIRDVEAFTENFKSKTINLAIGYSGRAEIVDAAKRIAADFHEKKINLDSLDEGAFKQYLYTPFQDPDLVIRTSGTQRLSGFLTYQSAYSELYFCPKYWPEFQEQDLADAVSAYDERERRFGK